MSTEREFRQRLQRLSDQDLIREYQSVTWRQWAEMPRSHLHHWVSEIKTREGVEERVGDFKMEIPLTPMAILVQRAMNTPTEDLSGPEDSSSTSGGTQKPGSATIASEYLEKLRRDPRSRQYKEEHKAALPEEEDSSTESRPSSSDLPPGSVSSTEFQLPSVQTTNGESAIGLARAAYAGPVPMIAPPSSEASSGAQTGVAGGYEMVAYQRLPLAGKRDAFLADGFLYVRQETLVGWLKKLQDGKCCPLARKGQPGHSSDCWIGNATR